MLTVEEKNKMITQRIKQYEVRIYDLEMNRTALESIGDVEGITTTDERIASLRKAIEAVETMREG